MFEEPTFEEPILERPSLLEVDEIVESEIGVWEPEILPVLVLEPPVALVRLLVLEKLLVLLL
jgi:hypothetical protein